MSKKKVRKRKKYTPSHNVYGVPLKDDPKEQEMRLTAEIFLDVKKREIPASKSPSLLDYIKIFFKKFWG